MNKRLIAKIMDGDTVIMTVDQNLLSVEFGALDRGSLTSVTEWGIYANRGSLSFIDNTGFFNDETINSVELLDYTIKFYLVDRISQYPIATFAVKSAEFDDSTRNVSIECVSRLEELQRKAEQEKYPFSNTRTDLLLSDCVSHPVTRGADEKVINSTYIHCPYFPQESTWNRLNKICQATMSRVFDDEKGNAIISGAFPGKTPIIVNPSNILDVTSADFVRIPNFSIVVTDRIKYEGGNGILPNVSETFSVSYDVSRDSAEITNCDTYKVYSTPTVEIQRFATIEKAITTPYKIKPGNVKVSGSLTNEDYVGSTLPITPTSTFVTRENFGDNSTVSADNPNVIRFVATVPKPIFHNKSSGDSVMIEESRVTSISIDILQADHFRDGDNVTESIIKNDNSDTFEISSNDLIQSRSFVLIPPSPYLADYILQEVSRRYGNGIECFEIECLFNDYFYEDGSKAFDGQDLSNHFKKYDVIIPYVVRRGQTVPLRKNADGTPKKFRIIGIFYSYDGLLRQKLQVQEERYDV